MAKKIYIGDTPLAGLAGKSAYQIWIDAGNVGTEADFLASLKGDTGAAGAAATVTVGSTTTGNPGTNASVTNSGTSSAAVLNFTIPKGEKGDQGNSGYTGAAGELEVVNNDTAGGATAAWSAERGKIIRQDLSQLGQELNVSVDIVLNEYPKIQGWISGTGAVTDTTGSAHYNIPLYGASSVHITAKTDYNAYIVFASAVSGHSWEKIGSRIVITKNTSEVVSVPTNAKYLVVGSRGTSTEAEDLVAPKSLSIIFSSPNDAMEYIEATYATTAEVNTALEQHRQEMLSRTSIEIGTDVDLSTATVADYYINASNNYANSGTHYRIPLSEDITKITIIAGTTGCVFALVKTDTPIAYASLDYATGEDGRRVVAANASTTIDKPEDADYLLVGKDTTDSQDYSPKRVILIQPEDLNAVVAQLRTAEQKNEADIEELSGIVEQNKFRSRGGIFVANWNIGHFSYGDHSYSDITSANYSTELAKYQDMLAKIDADLLALCEYSAVFGNDGNSDKLAKDVLFSDSPIMYEGAQSGFACNAIQSYKFLKNITSHAFTSVEGSYYYVTADLPMNGETVKIVSTHLTPDSTDESQLAEINELITLFASEQYVIMLADWNVKYTTDYSLFTTAGYTLANCGNFGTFETFTQNKTANNHALDNIITKGFKMYDVRVIAEELSDHYPIICGLMMQ